MIHATQDRVGRYYVSSDRLHRDATITKHNPSGLVRWQIKHVGNGARKNLASYQACIDYLKGKGW